MRGSAVGVVFAATLLTGVWLIAQSSTAAAADAPIMTTTTRSPDPAPPTPSTTEPTTPTSAATTEPSPTAAALPTTRLAPVDNRVSYSVGYDFGRALRERFHQA